MHPTLRTLDALINLVFPDLCPICKKETRVEDIPFCITCLAKLPFTGQERNNGAVFKSHFNDLVYPVFGIAVFQLTPGSGIAQMIHQIKYYKNTNLAVRLGSFIGDLLLQCDTSYGFTRIIPVPLHPRKKKKRGYNQSEEIAKGLAQKTGIMLDTKSLQRVRNTTTQTKLSRLKRMKNTQNAFLFNDEFLKNNEHILLVDDVLTTGSTLRACANSILEIKSVKISMLTIALGD